MMMNNDDDPCHRLLTPVPRNRNRSRRRFGSEILLISLEISASRSQFERRDLTVPDVEAFSGCPL